MNKSLFSLNFQEEAVIPVVFYGDGGPPIGNHWPV